MVDKLRFLNVASYTLYVAFMAILFAVVSIHHRPYLKRLQLAVALFVVNFVAAWWAMHHTTTHSIAFHTIFYFTMIFAPGVLLHVLLLPPNANNKPQVEEGISTILDPNTINVDDVGNNLSVITSYSQVRASEAQAEETSSNPDSNDNSDVQNNLSVISTNSHVEVTVAQGEVTFSNSDPNTINDVENILYVIRTETDTQVPLSEVVGEGTLSNPDPDTNEDFQNNLSVIAAEQQILLLLPSCLRHKVNKLLAIFIGMQTTICRSANKFSSFGGRNYQQS